MEPNEGARTAEPRNRGKPGDSSAWFLAADPDRLAGFLNMSGIAAEDIRAAAREPRFLAGVLEHMLGNEGLLVAFAADAGIDPAEVARARAALGGSGQRDVP